MSYQIEFDYYSEEIRERFGLESGRYINGCVRSGHWGLIWEFHLLTIRNTCSFLSNSREIPIKFSLNSSMPTSGPFNVLLPVQRFHPLSIVTTLCLSWCISRACEAARSPSDVRIKFRIWSNSNERLISACQLVRSTPAAQLLLQRHEKNSLPFFVIIIII
jgi:hypothetical protein